MDNPPSDRPGAWGAFWQTVIRFQREKMTPWIALRNAIGLAVPLAAGVVAGNVGAGINMATGALNVAFSDSHEPYSLRVRRMLAASALVAIAVFAGEASGQHILTAVAVAGAWAFAAGMLVSLSTTAADLGTMSLVTLVVYASVPQRPERAVLSGLLAGCGGLLQMLLAVAFWPVRRYGPERNALAAFYSGLARAAASSTPATSAPPASAESIQAQTTLAALGNDRSIEGERYRALLGQAERMRLALLMLSRLRARIEREHPESEDARELARYFEVAGTLLESIAQALRDGRPAGIHAECLRELQSLAEDVRRHAESDALYAMLADARRQLDALTGQLRSALDLAAYATPEGMEAFARREHRRPWRLRLQGTIATLRANLSPGSAAFRHAVRLAICVAIGDAFGRSFGLHRSYWLPMTVAIVLKPDFTATFSRGVLRLAGTMLGLVVATGLFHVLPSWPLAHVLLIGLLMYVLRWVGPANYGILVMAVTAMVVLLVGLTGVAPNDVMAARAVNTVFGGVIALTAYAAWPTWERTQAPETVARMLDAYRDYFHAIQRSYRAGDGPSADLEPVRQAARLARSNAEASIDRLIAEPRTPDRVIGLLSGLLASSHRLIHAMMALEAGLASSHPVPARAPFAPFADHVERTLHSLAAALRGSPLTPQDLPDLRDLHHALTLSGDSLTERYALVNVETDRITNSLNTLAEDVFRWVQP